MGRNSNFNEDSLKAGWLSKRSQLKSRFPAFATSYKERWFVLTRNALIYYDSQEPARRKEKGRLLVKEVKNFFLNHNITCLRPAMPSLLKDTRF